ncbi:MAG: long-chain-fatty-acid--CoA ligase [Gammaproteobacteria bacterium RIFCSPHIGHO2_12_FULL_43_28]|nr:MAG: long-chain-fatty-acid--CoA ligase [Gammaproteobacteria bacterium RIFCSPHIGHO2_12_FULL_43_28]
MEKIWLKSYPPGIPAEINPDAYQSIVEIIEKSFQQHAHLPAFYSLGKTITYNQLDKYSRDFAAFLQQVLKLKKGDRVAIMLPNVLQYPVAMFGALRAGLVVINVNPLYTADELTFQLANSGAATIVALENFAHTVEKAAANVAQLKNIIITKGGDMLSLVRGTITNFMLKYVLKKVPDWHIPNAITFKNALAEGRNKPFTPVVLTNSDIAFLQYTGGTTGIAKGAILTHRNLVANLQQAEAWFKNLLVDSQEVIITALPLYHIFSLTANCLFFTKIGGLNVLIVNPRDIPFTIKEMQKFKFTAVTGVNTLFNALLKDPHFESLDFSKLRLSLGGGMAVQKVVADKWQEVTKAPLLEAYGLTETSPCVTINPTNLKSYNGTIGLPVSSTDVCILDDDRNELPIGEVGELAIKGPQVMYGYWQNPSETEKVFTEDGWLLTGDMASIDENGFITLHERKKDMILVSGFNVYPNEVEEVIAKIRGVREVAVIGVPDENSGEAVRAYVVKEDENLTPERIIAEARRHLTAYKIPRKIEFCEELPKTNVGKILRRALREKAV